METRYPHSKDPNSTESGLEFQDFVADRLAPLGLTLQYYTSRKFQYERGESRGGIEVKLDRRCTETGRLSIETAEKTTMFAKDWTPSGIYRSDNTWLYVQGNYTILFIFQKHILQSLHRSQRYPEHEIPTLQAFFLPFEDARRYGTVLDFRGKSS